VFDFIIRYAQRYWRKFLVGKWAATALLDTKRNWMRIGLADGSIEEVT
jgi:hypothetical protein